MIYLLDTDMLIYMVRGLKSAKNPKNRQRVQALVALAATLVLSNNLAHFSRVKGLTAVNWL